MNFLKEKENPFHRNFTAVSLTSQDSPTCSGAIYSKTLSEEEKQNEIDKEILEAWSKIISGMSRVIKFDMTLDEKLILLQRCFHFLETYEPR